MFLSPHKIEKLTIWIVANFSWKKDQIKKKKGITRLEKLKDK